MTQSEKLNLWDRFFNRYRREIVQEGNEEWCSFNHVGDVRYKYNRNYVKYKVVDRVTGSEKIEKVYLN